MPATAHAPAPAKKRGFFCNPIMLHRAGEARAKREAYANLVRIMSGNSSQAVAARAIFSTLAGRDHGNHHLVSHRQLEAQITSLERAGLMDRNRKNAIMELVVRLETVAAPGAEKKGVHQIARVIRQLKALGHEVEVRDYDEPAHRRFILLAKRNGGRPVRAPFSDAGTTVPNVPGMPADVAGSRRYVWARDQHSKVGGRRIKPRSLTDPWNLDNSPKEFGEGGTLLPINDHEFVTSEEFRNDPQLLALKEKGVRFHFMPSGMRYHELLSKTMGKPTYAESTHLDMILNVLPQQGVLTVDNHYYWRHHAQVRALQKTLKLHRLVVVSKAESRYHPTNFLELGDGRVLVARNCPNFISQLREAGVKVVETDVDLDEFVHNAGGLRCFFNELD